jgi:molybdopterin/thiamine biosynthesis adenylyltransferase
LNSFGFESQNRISNLSILAIGCGGLASFALPLLVASGVKSLMLIDDDIVEISNLQRQVFFTDSDIGQEKSRVLASRLQSLNSGVFIDFSVQKNDSFERLIEIAKNFDIILDLTDSLESRLISNRVAVILSKPFFTGAAERFSGHVYSFFGANSNYACYECLFSQMDDPKKTCSEVGVFAPLVGVVGSKIAGNVLFYGMNNFTIFEKAEFFDLQSNVSRFVRIKKDAKCSICR